MTSATPKPRAGEQFRHIPDIIAQLEAERGLLRERERELVEALAQIRALPDRAEASAAKHLADTAFAKHGR